MNMVTASPRFSRADYELLPEGFPAQLIDGCLVKEPSPSYGHQWVLGRIYRALALLVGDRAVPAPIDVGLDDWNVFQPDVVVLSGVPDASRHDVGVPLLAVEVLSSGTARLDRAAKLPHLLQAGVAEVWLVDPASGSIEVHAPTGVRIARGADRIASAVVAGFGLVPQELLRPPQG